MLSKSSGFTGLSERRSSFISLRLGTPLGNTFSKPLSLLSLAWGRTKVKVVAALLFPLHFPAASFYLRAMTTAAAATQFMPVVATAGAARNALVVSIHDVHPGNRAEIDSMMDEIGRRGVRACSLLVVPHYHRQRAMADDPTFLSWLRERETAGHEIVIHGFFHQRPRKEKETAGQRFVTRIYTQDEGEFYDIEFEEALRRIREAQAVFTAAGLKPSGFIAPAWLLSHEGERAARECEIEYTTRLRSVLDLRSGRAFAARSLVYSVRNSWRRSVSLAWNGVLFQAVHENPLLRLSIHPPDHSFPEIWRQIERFLEKAQETRTATTYGEWVAEQRLQTAA